MIAAWRMRDSRWASRPPISSSLPAIRRFKIAISPSFEVRRAANRPRLAGEDPGQLCVAGAGSGAALPSK
jgi:hypothetical protein